MIFSPQKRAKKALKTKKGPKGISDFHCFFFKIINPIPIIAPKKKAKKRQIKILGQDKIRPSKIANLKSPQPIQVSLEKKIKAKKKKAGKKLKNKFQILNISQLPIFQILNN